MTIKFKCIKCDTTKNEDAFGVGSLRNYTYICIECQRDLDRKKNIGAKLWCIEALGGKCVTCGITDLRVLQFNHKTLIRNRCRPAGVTLARKLHAGTESLNDFDLRCANCNILHYYDVRGLPRSSSHTKLRGKVIKKLGGKCVVCGTGDMRILQINHLNGTAGNTWRRYYEKNIGYHFLRAILNDERQGEIDLRCANHNQSYEYETGKWSSEGLRPSLETSVHAETPGGLPI